MTPEQDYYENPQHWTEEKYEGPEMQRIPILAQKIPPNVKSVLDAGCGNGLFLRHLLNEPQQKFKRLCGMDRSNAALAHVVGEKINGSIDAIPFLDREFDIVTSTEVLEHLPQDIYIKAKEEISRVANQWIMITVPYDERIELSQTICNLCHCSFNPNYHLRSFDEKAIRNLFADKGFMCREVFKIHSQNKVPDSIERVIRSLGVIKRAILGQSKSPMRKNTICPACGHKNQVGNEDRGANQESESATLGMKLRALLSVERTYRWIGAVYEREETKI